MITYGLLVWFLVMVFFCGCGVDKLPGDTVFRGLLVFGGILLCGRALRFVELSVDLGFSCLFLVVFGFVFGWVFCARAELKLFCSTMLWVEHRGFVCGFVISFYLCLRCFCLGYFGLRIMGWGFNT